MTTLENAASKWETLKPVAVALAFGLVLGPVISNLAGVQVMTSTARAQVKAAVVDQQASFCEARARAEIGDTSKLDWNAQFDLAKKWAVLPGATSADPDVASACASKLTG